MYYFISAQEDKTFYYWQFEEEIWSIDVVPDDYEIYDSSLQKAKEQWKKACLFWEGKEATIYLNEATPYVDDLGLDQEDFKEIEKKVIKTGFLNIKEDLVKDLGDFLKDAILVYIQKRALKEFRIKVEQSKVSDSLYVIIENKETGEEYDVRISDHNDFFNKEERLYHVYISPERKEVYEYTDELQEALQVVFAFIK